MGEDKIIIELSNITFSYPTSKQHVLNKLNFILSKGDKVGLTGENGSGKTTLLHLIMGLLKPCEGEIKIFGNKRQNESDFREVRERIGFLFQDADDQLFCPTVAEDIGFGPLNLGKTHAEARRIVRETLESLDLLGLEERVTYNLSSGEKKLVSLATVLAMKPEILLFDEPTAGLDDDKTERVIEILNNNINLSYIIVSHDKQLLKKTTHDVYRMDGGKVKKFY